MERTNIVKAFDVSKISPTVHQSHRNGYGRVTLLSIGGVTFVTFGALVGLGAFFALLHTGFFLGATGGLPNPQIINHLAILLAVGIPVSAYVITRILDLPAWLRGEKSFTEHLRTVSFGLWGGLIGGLSIILLFTRINQINSLHLLDAAVLGLPLAQFFGRWGCLNYGCCHGREAKHHSRFSIRYHDPMTKIIRYSPHLLGKPIYPTQIYAMLANGVLYACLMGVWLLWPARPVGFLAALYMLGYGIKRFVIEFFRGEFPRIILGGFSFWQWLSLGFIIAGTVLLITISQSGQPVNLPDYENGWLLIRQSWPSLSLAALVMSLMYGIHGRKIGVW